MKFLRYFIVGGAAAIVDCLLFAVFTRYFHVPWFLSSLLSFTAATLVNYALSVRFVFNSGVRFKRRHHEVSAVFFVSFVGLLINQMSLWYFIELVGVDPLVSKIIGTGIVFFWNYGSRRYFVFKPSR